MVDALEVVYGDLVIGGASTNRIIGVPTYTKELDSFSFSCEFYLADETAGTFIAEIIQETDRATIPNKTFILRLSGNDERNLNPDDFDCFDPVGVIEKTGSEGDTTKTRVFTFRYTCRLDPAKEGYGGRSGTRFALTYDLNRARTGVFTGTYHADPDTSDNAREVFLAKGKQWALKVLEGLDAPPKTWQLKREEWLEPEGTNPDADEVDQPTQLDFVLEYEEIYSQQKLNADNDDRISDQTVRVVETTPGIKQGVVPGLPDARAFRSFRISYKVILDINQVKFLDALEVFTRTVLLSLAIQKVAKAYPEIQSGIIDNISTSQDEKENSVGVDYDIRSISNGSYVELSYEESLATDDGVLITPLLAGDEFLADVQKGFNTTILTRTLTAVQVGGQSPPDFPDPPDGYIRLRAPQQRALIRREGVPGNQRTILVTTQTDVWQKVKQYQGGGIQAVESGTTTVARGEEQTEYQRLTNRIQTTTNGTNDANVPKTQQGAGFNL